MKRRMVSLNPSLVLSAAAVVIASTGTAIAAIPGPSGEIKSCYLTSVSSSDGPGGERLGALRVIDSSASCGGREAQLTWSQRGPAGPAGAAGPQGPTGPAGPQGAAAPTPNSTVPITVVQRTASVRAGQLVITRCPTGTRAVAGGAGTGTLRLHESFPILQGQVAVGWATRLIGREAGHKHRQDLLNRTRSAGTPSHVHAYDPPGTVYLRSDTSRHQATFYAVCIGKLAFAGPR